MTILALDTSSRAAGCALVRDGVLLGEFYQNTALTHSQTILPMVEDMLLRTGAALSQVDVFAVSTGPGSFTGLRIGIAAVKGLAMGLGKPCAAVSTLEVLAWGASVFRGVVVPAMDARRQQVYTARFQAGEGGIVRLTPDTALSLAQLRGELETLHQPVLLVGDGAEIAYGAMEGLDHVSIAPERMRHQRAASVAAAALEAVQAGELCDPGDLHPAYLRLPQAERERLARLDNNKQREQGEGI